MGGIAWRRRVDDTAVDVEDDDDEGKMSGNKMAWKQCETAAVDLTSYESLSHVYKISQNYIIS